MTAHQTVPLDHKNSPGIQARCAGVRWALGLGLSVVLGSLATTAHAMAQPVLCHLSYAGAMRTFTVPAITQAEEVEPQLQGSSFVFKVVNKAAPFEEPVVRVSTYAVLGNEHFLLHRASYLSAQVRPANATHGFTGLQTVQEPVRGNELRYWCETGEAIKAAAR
jgi:hypothetical protein